MTQEATPPEQPAPTPETPELPGKPYRLELGGPELKAQRQAITDLLLLTTVQLPEYILDALSGVESLLSELANQAYDNYGIDGMLTPPLQTLRESLQRRCANTATRDVLARAVRQAISLETAAIEGGVVDEERMLSLLFSIVGDGPAHAILTEAINPPPPPPPPPAETPPEEPLPEATVPPETPEQ